MVQIDVGIKACMLGKAIREAGSWCAGAADALREDMVRSAWYEAFRADMRSNVIVRAVESSITGVGSVTVWTTSRLASASQRFMYAHLYELSPTNGTISLVMVSMRSCISGKCTCVHAGRATRGGHLQSGGPVRWLRG